MKKSLIVSLAVLFAGPAASSIELLLPIPGTSGLGVRYFADHELGRSDPKVEYAVVMIHGVTGGCSDYAQRLRNLIKGHPLADKVFFVAPCFPVKSMLDEDERRRIAYWEPRQWQAGNDSPVADALSSYDVLDMVFNHLNDIRLYPNLKHVLFCGYSAGGQVVCRYMAVSGIKPREGLSVDFAAGAPSSWLFLDRSVAWHCGLANRNRYASRVSDEDIFKNINDRFMLCFCGTADTGTKSLDVRPRAMAQGATRYERFKNFRKHIAAFPDIKGSFSFVEVEGLGHSGKCWGRIGIDKLIFGERKDESYAGEAELPRIDALVFTSEGSRVYGQVLVPSAKFAGARPCVIFCHGFAGFTRWDDVAHDLCRAGIAVVIPHHRGAWGSEGEYTVSGCIRDAENLARWALDAETAATYGLDTNAVYLAGHSMGGNSVVNAAARLAGVRGVVLAAPCDIGFMAQRMERETLKRFLVGEGMQALRRASDDSIVDDIRSHAADMRFVRAAPALRGKKVFLVTGEYDKTVPTEPLDAFWASLGDGVEKRRKIYRAGHSLMGVRLAFAADLKDFILATPRPRK